MTLRKIEAPLFPPRRWSLAGLPDTGKSTFATAMKSPLVVVDADQRFSEMVWLHGVDAYTPDIAPGDYADAAMIANAMDASMRQMRAGTIVVDSLTEIIAPRVAKAIADKAAGRIKNLSAGMVDKAMAMRLMQAAVTKWGADTLWIYHMNEGRDNKGNETVTSFISKTEQARLRRSLNLCLDVSLSHKISVTWSRYGRIATLVDTSGAWKHMPRRIEIAVYAPREFRSPEHSAEFAVQAEVIADINIARALYEEVKVQAKPQSSIEMATAWRESLDQYLVSGVPEMAPPETKEEADGLP